MNGNEPSGQSKVVGRLSESGTARECEGRATRILRPADLASMANGNIIPADIEGGTPVQAHPLPCGSIIVQDSRSRAVRVGAAPEVHEMACAHTDEHAKLHESLKAASGYLDGLSEDRIRVQERLDKLDSVVALLEGLVRQVLWTYQMLPDNKQRGSADELPVQIRAQIDSLNSIHTGD